MNWASPNGVMRYRGCYIGQEYEKVRFYTSTGLIISFGIKIESSHFLGIARVVVDVERPS